MAGALPVCSPPLRPAADRDALWTALAGGALDIVTTDHCPFTADEKATGLDDHSRIPGGVPSIESRVALVYDGLVIHAGGDQTAALQRWVSVCSTTPAHLLGFTHKGQLLPGCDADIVIFDPRCEWVVAPDSLCETAGWTPYDGQSVRGRAMTTISRGEIIVEAGQWRGAPGRGRFVPR